MSAHNIEMEEILYNIVTELLSTQNYAIYNTLNVSIRKVFFLYTTNIGLYEI